MNEPKLGPLDTLMKAVDDTLVNITDQEKVTVSGIIDAIDGISKVDITPAIAAYIFKNHNKYNRAIGLSKVQEYKEAMDRGEWKLTHQGIAFFEKDDSKFVQLADGQHRLAAIVLHGSPILASVGICVNKDVIDAIDRAKARNASESLEMKGVTEPKLKATIAKVAIDYTDKLSYGKSRKYSDYEIEKYVQEHDETLDEAITIATTSLVGISETCMTKAEASKAAFLAIIGGYPYDTVSLFITQTQQGIAHDANSPTIVLSRKFAKAKNASQTRDKLSSNDKLCVTLKGINLWSQGLIAAKIVYKKGKDELPPILPPEIIVDHTQPAQPVQQDVEFDDE